MVLENMTAAAIAEELGSRLKRARLNADLTQAEVAFRSGLSTRTVHNAENGSVQLQNLVAILISMGMVSQLNMFLPVQEISPLQLAKLKSQERQRASRTKKTTRINEDGPSW